MAAKDHLNQNLFYHGTTHDFKEGDFLEPQGKVLHGPSTGNHVYITSRDMAEEYAQMAVDQMSDMGHSNLVPRVFQVEPVGDVEVDPAGLKYTDDNDNEVTDDRRVPKARIIKKVWEGEGY